jgi:hypothetical protein
MLKKQRDLKSLVTELLKENHFLPDFLALFLGAAFLGAAFLATFLGAAFLGAAFLATFLGADFLGAAFLGAALLTADFAIEEKLDT